MILLTEDRDLATSGFSFTTNENTQWLHSVNAYLFLSV